jgi:hypothetical protein
MTITVDLLGGLGNQLFQIAAGYAAAKALGRPFYVRRHQFCGAGGQGKEPTRYYATVYKKIPFIDSLTIEATCKESGFTYSPIIDRIPSCVTTLHGYFQSEQYFASYSKDVKDLFTPQEGIIEWLKGKTILTQFPELAEDHDYCFIGVRRGDYLNRDNAAIHNPCGLAYYTEAMQRMGKSRYYIASDDVAWCRANFVGDQFRFIEADDIETFYAIALFRNYIIGNSTFHWWGSFLSIYDRPRIIAPDKWLFGPNVRKEQYWSIYRDTMEVIERPIEV